jgi:phenylalanine-4-hydroxylase
MPSVPISAKQSELPPNPQVARLPNHLRQFAVGQNWDKYTPIDHAVWRYIMRQAVHILRENAHRVYFKGLLETGINLDRIPRISEMNEILGKIGWGAVAVDGFIPPAAFMEYQAFKVLVIACDMRQINHIEYTPAPDIVHEAAGHAPIIVDQEYAAYLRRFGQVGARAMSSQADFELYQAIRHLSILKEAPNTNAEELTAAEKEVLNRQAHLGEPSEMALLSRLHWWTVEYGLIGDLINPKIYGAGLLSSIGEAVSCLDEGVKKIPYSLEAANYAFDITTKQPQLFVTPDFAHLDHVLDQFVASMAWTVGGAYGLSKAVATKNVCTAVYSSGLQVSGVISEVLRDSHGEPIYIRTTGPTALAVDDKELPGQGKTYHRDGFGSPVGKLRGHATPLGFISDGDLESIGIVKGNRSRIEFESGITVEGQLDQITRSNGVLVVLTFSDCTVQLGSNILFQPSWGTYDMAVGQRIVSVFGGAADKDAFEQVALVPRERTIRVNYDQQVRKLHHLYQHIRDIREGQSGVEGIRELWQILQSEHHEDWLTSVEILEVLVKRNLYPMLQTEIRGKLEERAENRPDLRKLITDAMHLIDIGFEPPKHAD